MVVFADVVSGQRDGLVEACLLRLRDALSQWWRLALARRTGRQATASGKDAYFSALQVYSTSAPVCCAQMLLALSNISRLVGSVNVL